MRRLHSYAMGAVLVIVILLLHFMIARPFGFPLTIAPFALVIFLFVSFKFAMGPMGIALLFLSFFWPLGVFLVNLFFGSENIDSGSYLRTYALWVFATSVIFVVIRARLPQRDFVSVIIARAAFVALSVIVVFSCAQVVAYEFFDSTALYNLLGEHLYLGEHGPSRFMAGDRVRSMALYLEPSFNAFVILTLYVICLIGKYRLFSSTIVSGIGLYTASSMVGFGAFTFLSALLFLNSTQYRTQGAKPLAFTLFVLLMIGGIFIIQGEYIFSRFLEIGFEGTSGYYRLIAPLVVLSDILLYSPLGLPFGQIESTLGMYHLAHGSGEGSSLDNGLYVIVFYFGWMGVFLLFLLISKVAMSIFVRKQRNLLIVLTYMFASLLFSGGILLPEYIILVSLVIYRYRLVRIYRPISTTSVRN